MRSNLLISRRTCLRGLGVALALPLLETMGWADEPKGAAVQAAGAPGLHVHAARRDPRAILADRPRQVSGVAAAHPGAAQARAGPVPGGERDQRRAHRPAGRRAARAGTVHLAHRHAAGHAPAGRGEHRDLRRPDRGQLRGRLHAAAVAGAGDDAADAHGAPGGAQRGVLLALQLPRPDAADAGGDQPAQRPQAALPVPRDGRCTGAPAPRPARPVGRRPGPLDARPGPRRRQGPARQAERAPTSTSSTNTWTASAPSSGGSPPSRRGRRKPPGPGPASPPPTAPPPIPCRSRSRSPRGTSAASTCG